MVDNGSTDDSVEIIRTEYPSVRLIQPGHNTFFSGGNNIGIQAARGDNLLLLNPDTEIHPGMLEKLLAYLNNHLDCGLVTARQLWTDGTTLPICSRFNRPVDLWMGATFVGSLLPGLRNRLRAQMWYADWDRMSDRDVDVAPGSCMLIPRHVIETVGAFDETMPMYFSDDDLCWRIWQAGYRIHYLADATLTHAERSTTRHISKRARALYYHDLNVYARKHFGLLRALPLQIAAQITRRLLDLKPG
ncbi:MAG: hypothetical protein Kow0077_24560 [Anaerolineae bacterium]